MLCHDSVSRPQASHACMLRCTAAAPAAATSARPADTPHLRQERVAAAQADWALECQQGKPKPTQEAALQARFCCGGGGCLGAWWSLVWSRAAALRALLRTAKFAALKLPAHSGELDPHGVSHCRVQVGRRHGITSGKWMLIGLQGERAGAVWAAVARAVYAEVGCSWAGRRSALERQGHARALQQMPGWHS